MPVLDPTPRNIRRARASHSSCRSATGRFRPGRPSRRGRVRNRDSRERMRSRAGSSVGILALVCVAEFFGKLAILAVNTLAYEGIARLLLGSSHDLGLFLDRLEDRRAAL